MLLALVAVTVAVICVLVTSVIVTEEKPSEATVRPVSKLVPVTVSVPFVPAEMMNLFDPLVGELIVGVEHGPVVVVVELVDVVVVAALATWGSPMITSVEVSVIVDEPNFGPMKEYEGLAVVTVTLTSSAPGAALAQPPDTGAVVPAW